MRERKSSANQSRTWFRVVDPILRAAELKDTELTDQQTDVRRADISPSMQCMNDSRSDKTPDHIRIEIRIASSMILSIAGERGTPVLFQSGFNRGDIKANGADVFLMNRLQFFAGWLVGKGGRHFV